MDLNNDGYLDILSGSYSRMEQPMAGLFQVLWGQANGTFKKTAVLNGTDKKPLIIPGKDVESICTRPMAVDWNGDGNLDLVVGNFEGSFYLFIGEGNGAFKPKPEVILAGKSLLKMRRSCHADPFVVDWDGDGDLDLLSGSSGVQWAENIAGAGKPPELKPFKVLIKPGPEIKYEQPKLLSEQNLTGPASSTRIWVADVNSDGKLDILVGDHVTLISAAKGVSKEEFMKRSAKWSEDFNAPNAAKRFQELNKQRSEFMREEGTGFVWLYLRK